MELACVSALLLKSPKSPRKPRGSPSKGKKKDPWATDSDGPSGSDSDLNFNDGEGSFIAQNTKERGPRRAAAKKIDYSFNEDDEIENMVLSDSNDEFVPTEAAVEAGSNFISRMNE
ncbi:hypothetical protein LOTGIDRAFT_239756 [Lottia gigantea]|uniref:Uncharacterized protein n=1 Tax=Lottia gigantea TaxID=225164 RepID=V4C167_LOTGI|nr:hypothetical protein LOTGIDRAFT_239756 [Lottia gigantea]ESO95219.1 hypothetical protein LOTGIDRAFT_239756 [Lottia gigantea]